MKPGRMFVLAICIVGLVTIFFQGQTLTRNDDQFLLPESKSNRSLGAVQVGEIKNVNLSISYQEGSQWVQEIFYPEAAYIKVHFQKMNLLDGDYITVSDPQGLQIHTYPGSGFTSDGQPGFWGLSILGDTAIIQLHSGIKLLEWRLGGHKAFLRELFSAFFDDNLGVDIDRFARGYSNLEFQNRINKADGVCGTDQRTDVICYQSSHPTEYQKADAVGVLLLDGTKICTAWRVSPLNRLFTNQHCVSTQSEIDNTEVWFNYQRLTCGSGDPQAPVIVAGDEFLIADISLDFTLFTVENFSSISGFGYLEMDNRAPVQDEEIYIPQHGDGNPKQFGIESDMNTGNVCRIDDPSRDFLLLGTDAGYYCDVFFGSSGAPVLARSSHKVIALNHFGPMGSTCNANSMNQGVRIDTIWPLVQYYFQVPYDTYLPVIIK